MIADKMILGKDAIFNTDSNETGLNNNVIICGSTGCGKTMSISEPRLLETFNSSLIATVTKRRIVNKYKSVFEDRGYVVEDLNFINPEKSSITYDPLQYIKSISDISCLAKSIVMSDSRKEESIADPYWDATAASLLSAEIAYILSTKENASFVDVLDLHDKLNLDERSSGQIWTSLDEEFMYLEKIDNGLSNFAISCWKSFKRNPFKTASCIYGALNTTIDKIFSEELRKMIAMDKKIDFEQLANQKTVLFISTSPVNPALNFFINTFYSQAFKTLFEYAESLPNGRLPIPVHVLCDDFATGSRIPNFPELISIFREKQISVTLLIQSESQLESMYGKGDATTIINNCDTYVYMGGMDTKTGYSIGERLNAPLDDVLYMPIGQEYIFRRGQKPIITTRYDIMKDERYLKITEEYEKRINGQER